MHAHVMHIQVGDETHDPFLGDDKLYEKREEQLRKRVNHRAMARKRDADRCEDLAIVCLSVCLSDPAGAVWGGE